MNQCENLALFRWNLKNFSVFDFSSCFAFYQIYIHLIRFITLQEMQPFSFSFKGLTKALTFQRLKINLTAEWPNQQSGTCLKRMNVVVGSATQKDHRRKLKCTMTESFLSSLIWQRLPVWPATSQWSSLTLHALNTGHTVTHCCCPRLAFVLKVTRHDPSLDWVSLAYWK